MRMHFCRKGVLGLRVYKICRHSKPTEIPDHVLADQSMDSTTDLPDELKLRNDEPPTEDETTNPNRRKASKEVSRQTVHL